LNFALIPVDRVTKRECVCASVCVYELLSLVHCLQTVMEIVVRSWRMESPNRIDSSRRRTPFDCC
ncbi:hypothetical protein M514_27467, partial [Trichuris suis]